MNIGARIKHFRQLTGLTGKALARMVNLDPSQIYKIESNTTKPSIDSLERICSALGITLAEFFAEEAPDMPPELRQVINKAKKLTPRQLRILNDVLDEWIDPSKGE